MYKLLFFSILGSLLMLTYANAATGSPKIFPFDFKTETLANGLKVIMIPTPAKGLVAYYSVVRTGSRDEWEPNHSGFAHFFEHMMFRGTKKYPGEVYDKMIIAMGANANAYTTDDYTCFHLNITIDNLEKVMELESDRFENLNYPEEAFKTESQAVYGEYRKGKTSPYTWIWEKMCDVAFTEHTYKHTTIGFEKDIIAMPTMYDYSLDFFKRYYRPENIVIVAVGDIQPEKFITLIKKYYSCWQTGYVQPQIKPEPEQKQERTALVKYPGKTLPILGIGYKGSAFNPNDKNDVATTMLGELAFGGNSDLYKKLYLKEQKIQSLEPEFGKNRDPFLWLIWAEIKDEKDINYVKDEIYRTITSFQNNPVDAGKLDALKKRMKYEFLMNLDTPDRVAGGLARFVAITGGIDAVNQYFAAVEKITPADIQNAAKIYFIPEKRTVITLLGSK